MISYITSNLEFADIVFIDYGVCRGCVGITRCGLKQLLQVPESIACPLLGWILEQFLLTETRDDRISIAL